MENKQHIIIDESGDKKYFTQIPNMIVNHSTAYEQSLYLVMKRLAGENGSCFASLNFLSGKMGVHKTTVAKTIIKLLQRKWIEEIEPKRVKGGIVRQFKIVDLWALNIKEYRSGAEMTTSKPVDKLGIKNQGGAESCRSGAVVDGSGAQSDTKKSYEEEHNNITDDEIKNNLRRYRTMTAGLLEKVAMTDHRGHTEAQEEAAAETRTSGQKSWQERNEETRAFKAEQEKYRNANI